MYISVFFCFFLRRSNHSKATRNTSNYIVKVSVNSIDSAPGVDTTLSLIKWRIFPLQICSGAKPSLSPDDRSFFDLGARKMCILITNCFIYISTSTVFWFIIQSSCSHLDVPLTKCKYFMKDIAAEIIERCLRFSVNKNHCALTTISSCAPAMPKWHKLI